MDTLTTKEAAVAGGVIGAALSTFLVVGIAVAVIGIIAGWKIFTKAGEKGWKILIPIYNLYLMYKIVGMNFWGWFCAEVVLSTLASLVGGMKATYDASGALTSMEMSPMGWIFYIASAIVSLVAMIIFVRRLAHAFKKGTGFAVGLFFLPFIFMLILAFGSAKYDKKAALKK